jgi:hypothetical protein
VAEDDEALDTTIGFFSEDLIGDIEDGVLAGEDTIVAQSEEDAVREFVGGQHIAGATDGDTALFIETDFAGDVAVTHFAIPDALVPSQVAGEDDAVGSHHTDLHGHGSASKDDA